MQIPFLLSVLAELALDIGDTPTAAHAIAEAQSLMEQSGERQVAPALVAMRERLGTA